MRLLAKTTSPGWRKTGWHLAARTFCSSDATASTPAPSSSSSSTSPLVKGHTFCSTTRTAPFPARPELDFDFLLDPANASRIEQNVRQRRAMGDLRRVHAAWARLREYVEPRAPQAANDADELRQLWDQLYTEASLLPNMSDPDAPVGDAEAARCVAQFGHKKERPPEGTRPPQQAEQLVVGWHALHYPRISSGGHAYALVASLANLERALLEHAVEFLHARLQQETGIGRLELVDGVHDILPVSTTRACGLQQRPSQPPIQYRVFGARDLRHVAEDEQPPQGPSSSVEKTPAEVNSYGGHCLSGTAEMGIAEKLKGRLFDEHELPAYFLAQSHCFRPEVCSGGIDSGLYRVHEFEKVEMFIVCTEHQSHAELERLVRLQRELFSTLELHCRILDMPSEELGAPAARKFDTEAWMPGRGAWGELASASNCTDYQARRLHIKYRPSSGGPLRFVHTCNGTGLASARALIAMLETHQTGRHKRVELPAAVRQRMPATRTPGMHMMMAKEAEYQFDE